MKISLLYFVLTITLYENVLSQSLDPERQIKIFLKVNYPKWDAVTTNKLTYNDYHVTLLRTPVTTYKTGLKIYKTQLTTGYYEYPTLEIAIALTSDYKIEVFESPTFRGPNIKFLDLVKGACVDSEVEKLTITEELSDVFKEITYEGAIVDVKLTEEGASSVLKHGRLNWRKLDFYFDQGCLKSIEMTKTKK